MQGHIIHILIQTLFSITDRWQKKEQFWELLLLLIVNDLIFIFDKKSPKKMFEIRLSSTIEALTFYCWIYN